MRKIGKWLAIAGLLIVETGATALVATATIWPYNLAIITIGVGVAVISTSVGFPYD
jgi:hypothetical protein